MTASIVQEKVDFVWRSSKAFGSWLLGLEFDALHRCCVIMLALFMLALSYVGASFLFSFFFNKELVHSEDTKKRNTGRY